MCTTQQNSEQEESKRVSYAIPLEIKPDMLEIKKYFGYDTLSLAVKNCILIGIQAYKKDPEAFREQVSALV